MFNTPHSHLHYSLATEAYHLATFLQHLFHLVRSLYRVLVPLLWTSPTNNLPNTITYHQSRTTGVASLTAGATPTTHPWTLCPLQVGFLQTKALLTRLPRVHGAQLVIQHPHLTIHNEASLPANGSIVVYPLPIPLIFSLPRAPQRYNASVNARGLSEAG